MVIIDNGETLLLTREQFHQLEPQAILPPNTVKEFWTPNLHYIQDPDQRDGSSYGDRSSYVQKLDHYKAILNPVIELTLEEVKERKIAEIKSACNAVIRSGFQSDALGSVHSYSSDLEDQLNLIGARLSNTPLTFGCTDNTNKKTQKSHTAAQLKKVFDDGLARKHQLMSRFYLLKGQVEVAVTKQAVEAIVWSE